MTKKQTVIFDIETMKSITYTAKQYQVNLINSLGGFKTGEMVYWAGRQTGKSFYYTGANLCNEIMFPEKPKSKYKFSRAKWYTAELNGDVVWRLGYDYNDIIAWCIENFGAHPKERDAWSRWYVGVGHIFFRDEVDLILYQLKWS